MLEQSEKKKRASTRDLFSLGKWLRSLFYSLIGGNARIVKSPKNPILIDLTEGPVLPEFDNDVLYLFSSQRSKQSRLINTFPQLVELAEEKYSVVSTVALPETIFEKKKALETNLHEKCKFTKTASHDLLFNNEISNNVVNDYFLALCAQDKSLAHIDSSYLYLKDLSKEIDKNPKYLSGTREKMKQATTILFPMSNSANSKSHNHYYLTIIKKTADGKYNFYCLDGFNSSDRKQYLKKAKATFEALMAPLKPIVNKEITIDIPKQTNGVDCGAVACYWAKMAARNLTLTHIPQGTCDYSAYRMDIAQNIVEYNNRKRAKPR